MLHRPEQLTASAPRAAQVGVGLLAAAIGGFIGLILFVNAKDWLLVPATRELTPTAAVIVGGATAAFVWFWAVLAYRLILNRPNREGGLFSSTLLYGIAIITLAASLSMVVAPGVRFDRRVRVLLCGPAMAAACWLLARRRATTAR